MITGLFLRDEQNRSSVSSKTVSFARRQTNVYQKLSILTVFIIFEAIPRRKVELCCTFKSIDKHSGAANDRNISRFKTAVSVVMKANLSTDNAFFGCRMSSRKPAWGICATGRRRRTRRGHLQVNTKRNQYILSITSNLLKFCNCVLKRELLYQSHIHLGAT